MLLINMKILSHISFFLLLHACLFCCVSCDSRQSAIGTDEICGLWMIDATDLSVVSGLGYSIYTNQVDHLLLLNDDGSCAYRGFEAYAIPRLWDYTEQFQHDSFLQEGSALWPRAFLGQNLGTCSTLILLYSSGRFKQRMDVQMLLAVITRINGLHGEL